MLYSPVVSIHLADPMRSAQNRYTLLPALFPEGVDSPQTILSSAALACPRHRQKNLYVSQSCECKQKENLETVDGWKEPQTYSQLIPHLL